MSCTPTKNQIQLYKLKRNRSIFIAIAIIIGTVFTFQSAYAVDSTIEIRISEDFFIDSDFTIEGFNTSLFSDQNLTIDEITNYSISSLGVWVISKDNPLFTLTPEQRYIFNVVPKLFPNILADLQQLKILSIRSIGNVFANNTLEAGSSYFVKVPRGLYIFGIRAQIQHSLNPFQEVVDIGDQFFFGEGIAGYFNNTNDELKTGYKSKIITINSLLFNEESFEFIQYVQDYADPDYLDYVDLEDVPTPNTYYFNATIEEGNYGSLFDIKLN